MANPVQVIEDCCMKYSRVALCWLLACLSGEALAWSNHSLGAAIALRDAKGVQGVEPVRR